MPSDSGTRPRVLAAESDTEASTTKSEERAREEALIEKCLDGDAEAFRPLVERYSPSLHTFVTRYVGSRDEARDIVQEAFLRSYRALPDFNPKYRFSTWLYRIALNLCHDHVKKAASMKLGQLSEMAVEQATMHDPIESRVDDRRLCEVALTLARSLPEKYRDPLLLKDVERMDYKQMARATGLSVGLLKIRVMRARRKLADQLQHRGLGPFATDDSNEDSPGE
jgi:RNA polymerase sigma-70 factor (ECF subfamily)